MLTAEQFVSNKQYFPEGWLRARRDGITATQVAKAATPAGLEQAVVDYHEDFVEFENPYMTFGKEMEPVVSRTVHTKYGILPNEWLIRHANHPHHLATPDGLSLDHELISEVKTTGQDWEDKAIPIQYRRQVQWQLHVTGAKRCLFAYMKRIEVDGVFAPAWFEPKCLWIERDEDMIGALIITAELLWERVSDGQEG
jgi:putative phage-type endonuclease